ncbi:hypothetical protein U1839_08515 [Sphingomonas sp. RT2P30]|uniref:hypothetical protein n=1 Tax=Parasphingomonas halimpatiens TaxID=3096162 RepID=UPI002FC7FAE3
MPVLALLLSAQLASAPLAPPETIYPDITVIDVSARPPDSGVLHTFVGILGRTSAGDIVSFKLTYFGAGQPIPSVASLCTFTGGMSPDAAGKTIVDISRFKCTLSSESAFIAPPVMRAQPFYH